MKKPAQNKMEKYAGMMKSVLMIIYFLPQILSNAVKNLVKNLKNQHVSKITMFVDQNVTAMKNKPLMNVNSPEMSVAQQKHQEVYSG